MTSVNPWSWADDTLVCFNLTRDRAPDEVLRCYGADPSRARRMTRRETAEVLGLPEGDTVLRVGRAGAWTFCFENWMPVGFDPRLLEQLSAGTDTIHFFLNPKGGRFVRHLRDGQGVEFFELGTGPAPQGRAPLGLHRAVTERMVERSADRYGALWEVLSGLTGVPLDDALVNGPLLTVLLPSPTAPAP